MTVFNVTVTFALLGGSLLAMWVYSWTKRGQTFSRDIMDAKKRTGVWISPKLFVRHWPAFVAIIGVILGIGFIAAGL